MRKLSCHSRAKFVQKNGIHNRCWEASKQTASHQPRLSEPTETGSSIQPWSSIQPGSSIQPPLPRKYARRTCVRSQPAGSCRQPAWPSYKERKIKIHRSQRHLLFEADRSRLPGMICAAVSRQARQRQGHTAGPGHTTTKSSVFPLP